MKMSILCKSDLNPKMNTIQIYQTMQIKEIEQDNVRLTREEGGGGITITTSQQPQPTPTQIIHPPTTTQMQTQNQQIQPQQPARTIVMDHDEKKMRRQIANSNERRRMQSINAGFQSLRQLLPHHEGEKLSKAAILQQTAEYIERLEQEKQRLFQQNQHLKRLLEQQEGGANNNNNNVEYPSQVVQQQISTSPSSNTTTTVVPSVKKRKLEAVMTIQTDSSDEGLGSMSPEPISQMTGSATTKTHTTHVINAPISSVVTAKDYQDLQKQMETERQHRLKLEEELKNLQSQFYSSERIQFPTKYVYHRQDDHINLREEIIDELSGRDRDEDKVIMHGNGQAIIQDGSVQYAIESVPAHHQYVVCTTVSPASTPRHIQEVMIEDDDSSRTLSSDELNKEEPKIILTSKGIKRSPNHYNTSRMPSILEQAIKAEPKVEVERINSPSTIPIPCSEDAIHSPPPSRSPVSITISRNVAPPPVRTYPTNSARPNLETIVEAIRHLEGDALFDMVDQDQCKQAPSPSPQPQDVPLALTTHKYSKETRQQDIHPFLKFHTAEPSQGASLPTIQVTTTAGNNKMHTIYQHQQNQQQCFRPGVIVVKK